MPLSNTKPASVLPRCVRASTSVQPPRSGSRASRWANAEIGRDQSKVPIGALTNDHSAYAPNGEEMTSTMASKGLKVGVRGIYHAQVVLHQEA